MGKRAVLPRCTPCRQRRGKVHGGHGQDAAVSMHPVQAAPRQRHIPYRPRSAHCDAPRAGSAEAKAPPPDMASTRPDAPRAGSAEAKTAQVKAAKGSKRCTPCRQRRGKAGPALGRPPKDRDAPRAGSAEAKQMMQVYNVVAADAPRAGSAEAKNQFSLALAFRIMMHPVQAAHSEITTCRPMVL